MTVIFTKVAGMWRFHALATNQELLTSLTGDLTSHGVQFRTLPLLSNDISRIDEMEDSLNV